MIRGLYRLLINFGYNRLCIKMALGPISPSQMFYYSALLFNTANSGWSIHAQVPMIFVGSKELYRAGIGVLEPDTICKWVDGMGHLDWMFYHKAFHLQNSLGLKEAFIQSYNSIVWELDGYFDAQTACIGCKVFIQMSIHCTSAKQDAHWVLVLMGAWLTNAVWSSTSVRWTQHLEDVSISLLYQVPTLQRASLKGSILKFKYLIDHQT